MILYYHNDDDDPPEPVGNGKGNYFATEYLLDWICGSGLLNK